MCIAIGLSCLLIYFFCKRSYHPGKASKVANVLSRKKTRCSYYLIDMNLVVVLVSFLVDPSYFVRGFGRTFFEEWGDDETCFFVEGSRGIDPFRGRFGPPRPIVFLTHVIRHAHFKILGSPKNYYDVS